MSTFCDSSRRTIMHSIVTVTGLALLALVSAGCVSNKSARLSQTAEKQLLVAPARSQPVLIVSEHVSSVLFGGLTGVLIEKAATSQVRRTLEDRLNADLKDFTPEAALAEECLKLLKTSSKVRFKEITLRADSLDIPGRSELIQHEANPFKTSTKNQFDWHMVYARWLKTPPTYGATGFSDGGQAELALEVTFPMLLLNHGNRLEMNAAMRLLDLKSGRIVGKQYSAGIYKLTPITATSDIKVFLAEFQKCLSEIAHQSLKELKLL